MNKRLTWTERFARHVRVGDGCWEWTGYRAGGYGRFSLDYSMSPQAAHRVAYLLYNGPIPDGMCVCHRCDNRGCVNPDHLWLGTNRENLLDMCAKGRKPPVSEAFRRTKQLGERNGQSKLNAERVREIRRRLAAGERTADIARQMGVDRSLLSHIKSGKVWSHVA